MSLKKAPPPSSLSTAEAAVLTTIERAAPSETATAKIGGEANAITDCTMTEIQESSTDATAAGTGNGTKNNDDMTVPMDIDNPQQQQQQQQQLLQQRHFDNNNNKDPPLVLAPSYQLPLKCRVLCHGLQHGKAKELNGHLGIVEEYIFDNHNHSNRNHNHNNDYTTTTTINSNNFSSYSYFTSTTSSSSGRYKIRPLGRSAKKIFSSKYVAIRPTNLKIVPDSTFIATITTTTKKIITPPPMPPPPEAAETATATMDIQKESEDNNNNNNNNSNKKQKVESPPPQQQESQKDPPLPSTSAATATATATTAATSNPKKSKSKKGSNSPKQQIQTITKTERIPLECRVEWSNHPNIKDQQLIVKLVYSNCWGTKEELISQRKQQQQQQQPQPQQLLNNNHASNDNDNYNDNDDVFEVINTRIDYDLHISVDQYLHGNEILILSHKPLFGQLYDAMMDYELLHELDDLQVPVGLNGTLPLCRLKFRYPHDEDFEDYDTYTNNNNDNNDNDNFIDYHHEEHGDYRNDYGNGHDNDVYPNGNDNNNNDNNNNNSNGDVNTHPYQNSQLKQPPPAPPLLGDAPSELEHEGDVMTTTITTTTVNGDQNEHEELCQGPTSKRLKKEMEE